MSELESFKTTVALVPLPEGMQICIPWIMVDALGAPVASSVEFENRIRAMMALTKLFEIGWKDFRDNQHHKIEEN